MRQPTLTKYCSTWIGPGELFVPFHHWQKCTKRIDISFKHRWFWKSMDAWRGKRKQTKNIIERIYLLHLICIGNILHVNLKNKLLCWITLKELKLIRDIPFYFFLLSSGISFRFKIFSTPQVVKAINKERENCPRGVFSREIHWQEKRQFKRKAAIFLIREMI